MSAAEELLDIGRRAVAEADPDDLWRRALQEAEALKVLVLGHENKSVSRRVCPDGAVGAAANPTPVTCTEPGYRSARTPTKLLARFSSRRSLGSGSGDAEDPALAFRGERKTGTDVVARQLREIGEDVGLAHARRQVRQDVPDGDAGPADARLPEANLRVDRDPAPVIHAQDRRLVMGVQARRWTPRRFYAVTVRMGFCLPNAQDHPRPKAVG